MQNNRIYNHGTNETYEYDPTGSKVIQTYPGDTTGGGPAAIPSMTSDEMRRAAVAGSKNPIDYGALVKNIAADAVTSGIPMVMNRFAPGSGTLTRMATGALGSTILDTALNAGNDKPMLQSGVEGMLNSLLGIGLPAVANAALGGKIKIPGFGNTATTTTNQAPTIMSREASGSRTARSATEATSLAELESMLRSEFDRQNQTSRTGTTLADTTTTGTAKGTRATTGDVSTQIQNVLDTLFSRQQQGTSAGTTGAKGVSTGESRPMFEEVIQEFAKRGFFQPPTIKTMEPVEGGRTSRFQFKRSGESAGQTSGTTTGESAATNKGTRDTSSSQNTEFNTLMDQLRSLVSTSKSAASGTASGTGLNTRVGTNRGTRKASTSGSGENELRGSSIVTPGQKVVTTESSPTNTILKIMDIVRKTQLTPGNRISPLVQFLIGLGATGAQDLLDQPRQQP